MENLSVTHRRAPWNTKDVNWQGFGDAVDTSIARSIPEAQKQLNFGTNTFFMQNRQTHQPMVNVRVPRRQKMTVQPPKNGNGKPRWAALSINRGQQAYCGGTANKVGRIHRWSRTQFWSGPYLANHYSPVRFPRFTGIRWTFSTQRTRLYFKPKKSQCLHGTKFHPCSMACHSFNGTSHY